MAEFVTKATREALALGHSWVGPDHVLLALTLDAEIGPRLAELGLSHERLTEYLGSRRFDPPPPPLEPNRSPHANPLLYRVMGWAHGFAAERGTEPTAYDWLLATIFEAVAESGLLEDFGLTAEDLVRRLAEGGIPVPEKTPPTYRPWRNERRIYVDDDDVEPLISLLIQRYTPGSDLRWGLNRATSESQVYFNAEGDIDLDAMLAEVRGGNASGARS